MQPEGEMDFNNRFESIFFPEGMFGVINVPAQFFVI
jgi:hypothetical protein